MKEIILFETIFYTLKNFSNFRQQKLYLMVLYAFSHHIFI